MEQLKRHPSLLNADSAVLVVIDMQEPFLRGIYQREALIRNVQILLQGANVLRIPMLATTQVREKMGDMAPEIREHFAQNRPSIDKRSFSAVFNPVFAAEMSRTGRKQVILCGVESHICVCQTALDLKAAGMQVHVVMDAISSRTESNLRLGIEKMLQGGVVSASTEGVLYEILEGAGTADFREVLKLVK